MGYSIFKDHLIDGVVSSQFTDAVEETTETETKQSQAKDGHNDDDVVGIHDSFLHHLSNENIAFSIKSNCKWWKMNLAMFFVVTEFTVDAAITAQRTVNAHSILAIKLCGYAFGRSWLSRAKEKEKNLRFMILKWGEDRQTFGFAIQSDGCKESVESGSQNRVLGK